MTEPIEEVRKLRRELETKALTKETWELAKKVLEELEEMERRWGRVARASLGGHVK